MGEKEFCVDLSGYDAGIYILQLVSSRGVETIKIVKKITPNTKKTQKYTFSEMFAHTHKCCIFAVEKKEI